MKAVRSSRTQKLNTSRKADVSLTLNLTAEQFARLAVLAKMVNTTPENLAIVEIFSGVDGWASWGEFRENIDDEIALYTEVPAAASLNELGERLEDCAPARIKRMAGYISPEPGSLAKLSLEQLPPYVRGWLTAYCLKSNFDVESVVRLAVKSIHERHPTIKAVNEAMDEFTSQEVAHA